MISSHTSKLSKTFRCSIGATIWIMTTMASCYAPGATRLCEPECTQSGRIKSVKSDLADDFISPFTSDALGNAIARLRSSNLCERSCRVTAIRVSNGVLWVGTDHGLAAFEKEAWHTWTVADGLPVEAVTALDVDDATGDLWLGMLGGGLVRLTSGRLDVFDQFNSGLAGNLVFGVAVYYGRVYAATNGGVCAFDPKGDAWELPIARTADGSSGVVVDLVADENALYARFWTGGIRQFDETSGTFKSAHTHLFDERRKLLLQFARPELEVKSDVPMIALLGPGTRRMPLPGDDSARMVDNQPSLLAARIALEQPFRTRGMTRVGLWSRTPGYASYGWGLLEDDLITFAANREIVGLIAHLDVQQQYPAASIAAFDIPTVNIAAEPLLDNKRDTNHRWGFQCLGGEARQYRELFEYIVNHEHRKRWVIVGDVEGADPRTSWAMSYARHVGLPVPTIVRWEDSRTSTDAVFGVVLKEQSDVVIFWSESTDPLELLATMTKTAPGVLLVVGPSAVREKFASQVADHPNQVLALAPRIDDPTCAEALESGSSSFKGLNVHKAPTSIECRTFDAADHLQAAIQLGSASRQGVRQSLLQMEQDIFGERHFERSHPNERIRIARIQDAHWVYEDIGPASTVMEDSGP